MTLWRYMEWLIVALAAYVLSSCALVGNNFPTSGDWVDSAIIAAKDEYTWVPLVGLATISLDSDWDQEISDWARENTPIYGSASTASNVSDGLLYGVAIPATIYSSGMHARKNTECTDAKGGCDNSAGCKTRYRDASFDLAAFGTAIATTSALKEGIGRTRPNLEDDKSFPSGHSTSAFSAAHLFRYNMNVVYPEQTMLWEVGAVTTASAIAWARVEAGKHYPRDILAGAALGNFMTSLVRGAYQMRNTQSKLLELTFIPEISTERLLITVRWEM